MLPKRKLPLFAVIDYFFLPFPCQERKKGLPLHSFLSLLFMSAHYMSARRSPNNCKKWPKFWNPNVGRMNVKKNAGAFILFKVPCNCARALRAAQRNPRIIVLVVNHNAWSFMTTISAEKSEKGESLKVSQYLLCKMRLLGILSNTFDGKGPFIKSSVWSQFWPFSGVYLLEFSRPETTCINST